MAFHKYLLKSLKNQERNQKFSQDSIHSSRWKLEMVNGNASETSKNHGNLNDSIKDYGATSIREGRTDRSRAVDPFWPRLKSRLASPLKRLASSVSCFLAQLILFLVPLCMSRSQSRKIEEK